MVRDAEASTTLSPARAAMQLTTLKAQVAALNEQLGLRPPTSRATSAASRSGFHETRSSSGAMWGVRAAASKKLWGLGVAVGWAGVSAGGTIRTRAAVGWAGVSAGGTMRRQGVRSWALATTTGTVVL